MQALPDSLSSTVTFTCIVGGINTLNAYLTDAGMQAPSSCNILFILLMLLYRYCTTLWCSLAPYCTIVHQFKLLKGVIQFKRTELAELSLVIGSNKTFEFCSAAQRHANIETRSEFVPNS